MKTHVCLVSEQAAANLLPALDAQLKPQKVVLVVSAKMQRRADNLASVFKENAIQVTTCTLGDEHDFHKTEADLLDLATRINVDEVTLNITGGTKLMSIAAQSVAMAGGWRMFYVDADTDRVIWLGRNEPAPHPLGQQLKLRHYLRSYGFELPKNPERPAPTVAQKTLTQNLVQQVGSLKDALADLNWLAQNAEERRSLSVQLDSRQLDSRSLDVLLRDFEKAGAINLQVDCIHFASESTRDFVKGGWLELHAIQAVHEVTGPLNIRDKAMGLEVQDAATQTRNELDIAFMARNRLFVIECKTARIDKPQGSADRSSPPKANDTLFKLAENCRRIGGYGTRGMLVSYRELRDPELKLAKALNIEVVAGRQIADLATHLKRWVSLGS